MLPGGGGSSSSPPQAVKPAAMPIAAKNFTQCLIQPVMAVLLGLVDEGSGDFGLLHYGAACTPDQRPRASRGGHWLQDVDAQIGAWSGRGPTTPVDSGRSTRVLG